MKTTIMLCAVAMLLQAGCTENVETAPLPEPENIYRALSWAEVEKELPVPEGAQALPRQKLEQVLGSGVCLGGGESASRIDAALASKGWAVDAREVMSDERVDYEAHRGPWVLSGSLTANPLPGCELGFLYTVRKVEAGR